MSEREFLAATAADEGWTEGAQIDVLLQYIENQGASDAFMDFLIGQKWVDDDDDPLPSNSFMWNLADSLQHAALAHDADFQEFCANVYDTMTIEEAASAWHERQGTQRARRIKVGYD